MGTVQSFIDRALSEGEGVLRLAPAFVPRQFCRPGRRLRLHPDDYYALGLTRGAIDERWFASTVRADNGPLTPEDEGLSYIVDQHGEKCLLLDAVNELKGDLIGHALYAKYQRWPMFSKFFDNAGPLPHHIHQSDEFAQRVGQWGKPEMYFYPAQYNNYGGEFPHTFFGLNPDTTPDMLKQVLMDFTKGDNHLLELSHAYKLKLDTGWDVPPGVLHAPGSLCTYEPQFASDVFSMFQSVLQGDHAVVEDNLWKNSPEALRGNFDDLIDMVDWDINLDPDFVKHRYMEPITVSDDGALREEWICYRSPVAGAKRLTIAPGAKVVYKDAVACGMLCIQGYGKLNTLNIAAPQLIRYGQLTDDEFFVPEQTAVKGISLENHSRTEPLVVLVHFAEHPNRESICP